MSLVPAEGPVSMEKAAQNPHIPRVSVKMVFCDPKGVLGWRR